MANSPTPTLGTPEEMPATVATTLATLDDVVTVPDTTSPADATVGEMLTP